jgi:2'-5' RNA ligase
VPLGAGARAVTSDDRADRFTSGVLLALPELAGFTARWRSTSYAPNHPDLPIERRFPPHVTVLTPWADPDDDDALDLLRTVARGLDPFELVFAEVGTFDRGSVVWLVPEPVGVLTEVLDAVHGAFPDRPPYGGRFADPVPHLTVSADAGPGVADEVRSALAEQGPLRARATSLDVYARGADGVWRERVRMPFGSASDNSASDNSGPDDERTVTT